MSRADEARVVEDLTREVINHPHFRTALEESVARQRRQPQGEQRHTGTGARRFESEQQEFSALFRPDRSRSGDVATTSRSSDRVNRRSCRQPAYSGFGRSSRVTARGKSSASSSIRKEVMLLPDPSWETVPRHSVKAGLIEDGFALNAFVMDKMWTAETLHKALNDSFSDQLLLPEGQTLG